MVAQCQAENLDIMSSETIIRLIRYSKNLERKKILIDRKF